MKIVLRGLKKDDWYADHSTGSFLGVQVEAGQQCADVKAIYAMPYHGSYNYKSEPFDYHPSLPWPPGT